MKVYRDLAYVGKRKRIATLSSIVGVGLLAAAFWLATTAGPSGVLFAYVPLLAGTIIFHLGMQQVGKWNRAQRNDVILDALLKDLGERYALVHYASAGKRTLDHALVYPGGVLAIVVRELPGSVAFRDGRWKKVGQGLSRFFGMGGAFLGNPSSDADADVQALQNLLEQEQLEADVDAVIAFVNPRVTLDIEEPEYPVVNGEGLKPYISSLRAGPALKVSTRVKASTSPKTAALAEATAEVDLGEPILQSAERQRIVEILTRNGEFEAPVAVSTRRPVKRRAA